MARWDPATYLKFADERSRPFHDLVARIDVEAPAHVVDLGCGPGGLTASLLERWPGADVLGLDSSPEMIAKAKAKFGGTAGVSFELGEISAFGPSRPVDVLVSNAAFQWVPGHRALFPKLVGAVAPGGVFAFGVPGNFDAPSHRLLAELAAAPRFRDFTAKVERPASFDAATYLADLGGLGLSVEAWETTYLHVLQGEDPVFTWISGTGARPVLEALPDSLREAFVAEFKAALREAYPPAPFGTVLPFRRIFVVAKKP